MTVVLVGSCHLALVIYARNILTAFSLFCALLHFSCGMKLNLDYLLERLWEYLALICIYTKKRGGTHTHLVSSLIRLSYTYEYTATK